VDIDPTLSLAFTIEANPGSYALLLGAGVSYGAVPTAWKILSTLVEELAVAQGVTTSDPMAWYETTYGKPPNYSEVLAGLSPSPAGRVGLLRPFFEGSPASEDGVEIEAPQPTEGHHAIARLMKAGFVKVVLTTNFDRLLEQALASIGVAPTVLSTPSAMAGALPLHQQTACIIKVHGDYLEPSFLNTGDELSSYHDEVSNKIGRVLDDYGLIVCGWSATWDVALRHQLEAHNPRRYANCWVEPSEPSEAAARLIQLRDATLVSKTSSDFFTGLEQSIVSIRNANQPHPQSISVAVANAKRFIAADDHIKLHDSLAGSFADAVSRVTKDSLAANAVNSWIRAIDLVDSAMALSMALVATVSQWGGPKEDEFWKSRLVELSFQPPVGNTDLWNLAYFPASLVLYTAGVGMLLANKMVELEILLRRSITIQTSDKPGPLCSELSAKRSLSCLGTEKESSQHIYEVVAPIFREQLLVSEESVRVAFDELELLMMLIAFDSGANSALDVRFASVGIIRRLGGLYFGAARPVSELERQRVDGVHPWTTIGLFDSDKDRLEALLARFNSTFATSGMYPGNY
jgi:hypothetical protein